MFLLFKYTKRKVSSLTHYSVPCLFHLLYPHRRTFRWTFSLQELENLLLPLSSAVHLSVHAPSLLSTGCLFLFGVSIDWLVFCGGGVRGLHALPVAPGPCPLASREGGILRCVGTYISSRWSRTVPTWWQQGQYMETLSAPSSVKVRPSLKNFFSRFDFGKYIFKVENRECN